MSEFLQVLCNACRACTNLLSLEPGPEQCDACNLKRPKSPTLASPPISPKRERLMQSRTTTLSPCRPTPGPPGPPTTSASSAAASTAAASVRAMAQPTAPTAARTVATPKAAATAAAVTNSGVVPTTVAPATSSTFAKTTATAADCDATASDAAGKCKRPARSAFIPQLTNRTLCCAGWPAGIDHSARSTAASLPSTTAATAAPSATVTATATATVSPQAATVTPQLPKGAAVDWSIEEVIQYISTDPALAVHADLFRTHVSIITPRMRSIDNAFIDS